MDELTGVDELGLEAHFQVMEDRGIIEESQVSHVFAFLKLGRVNLANLSRWEDFFLERTMNREVTPIQLKMEDDS